MRPPSLVDQRFESLYLFAACQLSPDETFVLALPRGSADAMTLFLEHFARQLAPDVHAVLVLDQAGWHGARALHIPETITPLPLLKCPRIDLTRSPNSLRDRSSVRPMTGSFPKIEVLDGPQRRRHWTAAEKLSIVVETYEPDATVSLVARRQGVALNQIFRWRKLAAQGALTATSAHEDLVAVSEYRDLQNQIRELQRLLGKKALEAEILKDTLEVATGPKRQLLRSLSPPKCVFRKMVSTSFTAS